MARDAACAGRRGEVLSVTVMDGVDADEVWLAVERDGVVGLEIGGGMRRVPGRMEPQRRYWSAV